MPRRDEATFITIAGARLDGAELLAGVVETLMGRLPRGLRPLLRLPIVRFLMVGMLGLCTDSAVFSLLHWHDLPDALARMASLGLATFVTWQLNRRFTFGASGRSRLVESSRYTAVAMMAQGLNFGLFLALRAWQPDWPALVSLLASAALAATLSFTGQRFFTFARHHAPRRARP